MIVKAFRLTNSRFVKTAFEGEGARLYGGRWNSPGTPMVYLAGSRSLATLEILVHTEDISTIEGRFSIIPVEIPKKIIITLANDNLPTDWSSPEPTSATQTFGDNWVREKRSAVISVPSAVTNGERNYLLNPTHPDFSRIEIGKAEVFRFDPRLL